MLNRLRAYAPYLFIASLLLVFGLWVFWMYQKDEARRDEICSSWREGQRLGAAAYATPQAVAGLNGYCS